MDDTVDSNSNHLRAKTGSDHRIMDAGRGDDCNCAFTADSPTDGADGVSNDGQWNNDSASDHKQQQQQTPEKKVGSLLNRLSIKRRPKLKNLKMDGQQGGEEGQGGGESGNPDLNKTWAASNFRKSLDMDRDRDDKRAGNPPSLEKSWHSSSCKAALRKATAEHLLDAETSLARAANSEGNLLVGGNGHITATPSGDELDGGGGGCNSSGDEATMQGGKKDTGGLMRRVSRKIKDSLRVGGGKRRGAGSSTYDGDIDRRKAAGIELIDFSADDPDHSGSLLKKNHLHGFGER